MATSITYNLLRAWVIPGNGYVNVHDLLGITPDNRIRLVNNGKPEFYAVESVLDPLKDDTRSVVVHSFTYPQYSITTAGNNDGKSLWVKNLTSQSARIAIFEVIES